MEPLRRTQEEWPAGACRCLARALRVFLAATILALRAHCDPLPVTFNVGTKNHGAPLSLPALSQALQPTRNQAKQVRSTQAGAGELPPRQSGRHQESSGITNTRPPGQPAGKAPRTKKIHQHPASFPPARAPLPLTWKQRLQLQLRQRRELLTRPSYSVNTAPSFQHPACWPAPRVSHATSNSYTNPFTSHQLSRPALGDTEIRFAPTSTLSLPPTFAPVARAEDSSVLPS